MLLFVPSFSGVTWQSTTKLDTTVRKGITDGTYDLIVENAIGNRGTAKGSYTVRSPPVFSATVTARPSRRALHGRRGLLPAAALRRRSLLWSGSALLGHSLHEASGQAAVSFPLPSP